MFAVAAAMTEEGIRRAAGALSRGLLEYSRLVCDYRSRDSSRGLFANTDVGYLGSMTGFDRGCAIDRLLWLRGLKSSSNRQALKSSSMLNVVGVVFQIKFATRWLG
jgi:hypothetical protein